MILKKILGFILGYYDRWARNLRSALLSYRLGSCGLGLKVDKQCYFSCPRNTYIGNEVIINYGVIIQATHKSKIVIGNNCTLSYRVQILTAGRIVENGGFGEMHSYKEVRIGNNVWLGANCVILPGVRIEDNVIVGAGAIVTKDLTSGFIYGGVPAKVLKAL